MYQQLVRDDPEDPPDLVIGGKQKEGLERNLLAEIVSLAADTVVILPGPDPTILEKPRNKADQLNMLESYQGAKVQVVTGVTIGTSLSQLSLAVLAHPPLNLRSPASDRYAWLLLRVIGGRDKRP